MNSYNHYWASLVAQTVKNPFAMWETWVRSLGWEDPLEEGLATHSSILAWRIPIDRGALLSCSPWSRKGSDRTERLNTQGSSILNFIHQMRKMSYRHDNEVNAVFKKETSLPSSISPTSPQAYTWYLQLLENKVMVYSSLDSQYLASWPRNTGWINLLKLYNLPNFKLE